MNYDQILALIHVVELPTIRLSAPLASLSQAVTIGKRQLRLQAVHAPYLALRSNAKRLYVAQSVSLKTITNLMANASS